jgi:DNA repair photolyase
MTRTEFDAGAVERPDFIAKLTRDAKKLKAAGIMPFTQVMLSFTTDPYHPGNNTLTRLTLETLMQYGFSFCTLTKGGHRALRDINLFRPGIDAFASTLTSLDPSFSLKWERMATLPEDRIETLKKFHARGIYTWVSLEPTLNTDASLQIVRETHEFVDLYKVGRANYLPMTNTTDWKTYTHRMVELLESKGAQYYIKKDLQPYLAEIGK